MSSIHYFANFPNKISICLQRIQSILKNQKDAVQLTYDLKSADSIHHQYDDKYYLAELLTNMTAASLLNTLNIIGFRNEDIGKLLQWSKNEGSSSQINLQFEITTSCTFVREYKFDIQSNQRVETERSVASVVIDKITSRVVTTVTEYEYLYSLNYTIRAFTGVGDNSKEVIVISCRASEQKLTSRSNTLPYPEKAFNKFETNLTWLLKHLDADSVFNFAIDRSALDCHTPFNNQEITEATKFFYDLSVWSNQVTNYFQRNFQIQPDFATKFDRNSFSCDGVFVPVVPIFSESRILIDHEVIGQLLAEQRRSLLDRTDSMKTLLPSDDPALEKSIISSTEASIMIALCHVEVLHHHFVDSIAFIEDMMRKQFIAAIGKEIQPSDFAEYMQYHYRNLFKEEYRPKPFSFAIRRTEMHSPEGVLRIDGGSEPIYTVSSRAKTPHMMQFAINASTTIRFGGDRYLHAFQCHSFSNASNRLDLIAQAKQFSSFIVLIGRIVSATIFDPKHAFIVKDKDEMCIPLELSQIPTAKEFRDAIESLSPEQQRFAKAYRAMQLESTLFGICVVQIKPQLEKVLNLPPDSLTKEIKLTRDLMDLFIKYQIPSDLLSFDEKAVENSRSLNPLEAVRKNVDAIQSMIQQAKKEEIREARMELDYSQPYASIQASYPTSTYDECEELSVQSAQPQTKFKKSSANLSRSFGMSTVFGAGGRGSGTSSLAPPPASVSMAPRLRESSMVPGSSAPPLPPAPVSTVTSGDAGPADGSIQVDSEKIFGFPNVASSEQSLIDYTKVPGKLDQLHDKYDGKSSVRATIINPGSVWKLRSQEALLAPQTSSTLDTKEQTTSRDATFDLLDALSRSGGLSLDHASLHVVIASTNNFDQSLLDAIIRSNVNPIEHVERSMLLISSAIHDASAVDLIENSQVPRVTAHSPQLLTLE